MILRAKSRSLRATKAFLCTMLTGAVVISMVPFAAEKAIAADGTKSADLASSTAELNAAQSYSYDRIYGPFFDKYALGINNGSSAGSADRLDIISPTDGITISIKASEVGADVVKDIADKLTRFATGERATIPFVLGVPQKSATNGSIVYKATKLDGKATSSLSTLQEQADYGLDPKTDGLATVFFRNTASGAEVHAYNGNGSEIGGMGFSMGYIDDGSGIIPKYTYRGEIVEGVKALYYKVQSKESSSTSWADYCGYQIEDKITELSSPNWDQLKTQIPLGSGTYLKYYSGPNWWDSGWRVVASDGTSWSINDASIGYIEGIGLWSRPENLGGGSNDVSIEILSYGGAHIKNLTIAGARYKSGTWYFNKSAIPNRWVLYVGDSYYAAYDSSLNVVTQQELYGYDHAKSWGKFAGKKVYGFRFASSPSDETLTCVDESLAPMKAGQYAIVGNRTYTSPVLTFPNGETSAVVKNASGKYGIVNASGSKLLNFDYDDFLYAGGTGYVLMKDASGWRFISLATFQDSGNNNAGVVKSTTHKSGKIDYDILDVGKTGGSVAVSTTSSNKNLTGNITIPNSVKISGQTFLVTAIPANAFKGSKITAVTLGDNITSIGANAFTNCKKLKSVTIGKKVKKIAKKAFYNCNSLKKITSKSKVLKFVGKQAIKNIHNKAKIKAPSSKKKVYTKKYKKLFKASTGFKKKTMKVT